MKKFKGSDKAVKLLERRYLLKNDEGKVVETPERMFERVAVWAALPEILYSKDYFDKNGNQKTDWEDFNAVKTDWSNNPEKYRFTIGSWHVNEWHFESFIRLYERLAKEGKMKKKLSIIVDEVKKNPPKEFVEWAEKFYDNMVEQKFMPNSPALMNAGTPLNMGSACFTVEVYDDLDSIFDTAKDIAKINKAGGGSGINISTLRATPDAAKYLSEFSGIPEEELREKLSMILEIESTDGVSSGAVSFLDNIYDKVLEVIKQGGKRRGAGMAIMEYWHPEIFNFIYAKRDNDGTSRIPNFNISIGTDEKFWEAVEKDGEIDIIAKKQKVKTLKDGSQSKYVVIDEKAERVVGIKARDILHEAAKIAWKAADPGMLFFDNANKYNPLREKRGDIRVSNPCGEEIIYPYESCNLASVNVSAFVSNGEFDWKGYAETVRVAAHFLDNVLDVNHLSLKKIEEATLDTRRIGVGLMGIAHAMFKLGIKYNSEKGFNFIEQIAKNTTFFSMVESVAVSRERGPFPAYGDSFYPEGKLPVKGYMEEIYPRIKERITSIDLQEIVVDDYEDLPWDKLAGAILKNGIRNLEVTTVPPTGSVSMISDTSSGLEPVFGLTFVKSVTVGDFAYADQVFIEHLRKKGCGNDEIISLLNKIAENKGALQGIDSDCISEYEKSVFVTAMEIHWADHVMAQALAQKWITTSISKTINMPNNARIEDVEATYVLAHELGAKGVTVYRDGSLNVQVYNMDGEVTIEPHLSDYTRMKLEELMSSKTWLREYLKDAFTRSAEKPITNNIGFIIGLGSRKRAEIVDFRAGATDEVVGDGEETCPVCGSPLIHESGCVTCPVCGWSKCTVG